MAIIVDKIQKRQDIALSCKKLVLDNGINNLTISQIANTAGIGKGTIYEYFKNKEDLVFEIVDFLLINHNEQKEINLKNVESTKEKVKVFLEFFHKESELREFYKEFKIIALASGNDEIISFNRECTTRYKDWLASIINEGIRRGEITEHSKKLVKGLFVAAEGMFINAYTTNKLDTLEEDLHSFIDALFELIEVK